MPFRLANVAGRAALVDASDQWYDLERVTAGRLGPDPMDVLADTDALHEVAARLDALSAGGSLLDAALEAPVPRPRNVFGVGLNYRTHAAESGVEVPTTPVVFGKFPSCVAGPGHAVELRSATADWEVELVVAIGRPGRDIAEADAWDHVAGLTVGQDISDRVLQFAAKPAHFDLGKSRDGYGPIGPVLVSPDAVADRDALSLSCSVNGHAKQADSTASLIFSVPQLVAYLSGVMTLSSGDLIFTGTPAGVGVASRTFLQPGDVIESTIEGIGTLVTRCVA
ncbi:MAG TPA: fumarylacetoacetate hydrolase family protein [Acidimicrobiales bacterium]